MRRTLALLTLFVFTGIGRASNPVAISSEEAFRHRIARVDSIRKADAEPFSGVQIQVIVDENGTVTSAQASESREDLARDAVALAKQWKYEPFERNGVRVSVTFPDSVSIFPPELPLARKVPFPEVRDWSTVLMSLQRTRCLGSCPAYKVQIDGKGNVAFYETYPGQIEQHTSIPQHEVQHLVELFERANYYSLSGSYRLNATDLPAYTTSISIDGQSMSVQDYGGLWTGMPSSIRELENAIDAAAGTDRWLRSSDHQAR